MQRRETFYEDRVVAYVDVLGFRDLVQRSSNSSSQQEQIRQILRSLAFAEPAWTRDSPLELVCGSLRRLGDQDAPASAARKIGQYASSESGTTFSDSVVLSVVSSSLGISHMIAALLALSIDLAEWGAYIRGGISLGLVHYDDNNPVGPAVLDAYRLEQTVATYPRIVISTEAYQAIASVSVASIGHLARYIRTDPNDGRPFLDFLGAPAMDLVALSRAESLREIRQQLLRQLSGRLADSRVRRKLDWLVSYFNTALAEVQAEGLEEITWYVGACADASNSVSRVGACH